jgi:phasin
MQKGPMGTFQIPPEMRSVAEKSVVQARQAFQSFMDAAQKAAAKMEEQAAAVQVDAKGTSEKIMGYAERNIAASFDFAQRLARAKDVQEIAKLQQEFIQAQMRAMTEQVQDLGQKVAQSAKGEAPGKR